MQRCRGNNTWYRIDLLTLSLTSIAGLHSVLLTPRVVGRLLSRRLQRLLLPVYIPRGMSSTLRTPASLHGQAALQQGAGRRTQDSSKGVRGIPLLVSICSAPKSSLYVLQWTRTDTNRPHEPPKFNKTRLEPYSPYTRSLRTRCILAYRRAMSCLAAAAAAAAAAVAYPVRRHTGCRIT